MTIQPRLISGSTALCFEAMSELQEAIAKMEMNNLSLISGSNGQDGLIALEGAGNKNALTFAMNQATDQLLGSIAQGVGGIGQGLTGFIGAGLGSRAAEPYSTEADQIDAQLNPTNALKVNAEPVLENNPKEIEMADFSAHSSGPDEEARLSTNEKATITAQNKTNAESETSVVSEKTKSQAEETKALETKRDGLRQKAESIRSQYQFYSQNVGSIVNGSGLVVQGTATMAATQNSGYANFAQGTTKLIGEVSGLTNSAISAEQGQEQAIAQMYSSIISLSGAARG